MTTPIRVLGLSGSLRQRSLNSALLRAAAEVLPTGMTLEVFDIRPIPMYDQDLQDAGWPEPVRVFRDRIAKADALLISMPEYNYSVPGGLKNAIDWASRGPQPPLDGKPLAIMGASPGGFGTVRGQMHLRQVCVFTNMLPLNKPELLVSKAADKFDADLNLTDAPTRQKLGELLAALAAWTHRLRGDKPL